MVIFIIRPIIAQHGTRPHVGHFEDIAEIFMKSERLVHIRVRFHFDKHAEHRLLRIHLVITVHTIFRLSLTTSFYWGNFGKPIFSTFVLWCHKRCSHVQKTLITNPIKEVTQ